MVSFLLTRHNFVSDLPFEVDSVSIFGIYLILKNEMTLRCFSGCRCICEANLINV